MRVLIVEDDDNKRSRLIEFLSESVPSASIDIAKSFQSGLRQVRDKAANLVLLDMTLPTYDIGPDESGGDMHPFGGRDFLRQMRRLNVLTPVIVVTQFETFGSGPDATTLAALDEELKKSYGKMYLGAVYYHAAIQSWKDELRRLIVRAGGGVDR